MRLIFTIIFFSVAVLISGQSVSMKYMFRVFLTDKGQINYSVSNPEDFLSKDAIDRKQTQQVKIEISDFPISEDYFGQIERVGAEVVTFSKWFETMVVKVADSSRIETIASLPFVKNVQYIWKGTDKKVDNKLRPRLDTQQCDEFQNYRTSFGATESQFKLHNAIDLVHSGFRGKGIIVAVIDAGFTNIDVIPAFEKIRVKGFTDIVQNGSIFNSSDHGTRVLSTMAVDEPGKMIGSASEAEYILIRSEDVKSEYPVEEDYWIRAVEIADSMGVDLINSSLGYTEFDDPQLNYRYSDLDGKTSLMTKAADMAFEKGMIVVSSMGNEGNKPWKYMTTPSDAKNVLSIGAVGVDSVITSFSSKGPTFDFRIKPDLVSVGKNTITIGQTGAIGTTNGTSLSSPFMAGLIASLWSINPTLNRSELINIVKQSADRYRNPDKEDGYGYGIPDIGKSMQIVLQTNKSNNKKYSDNDFSIYPDEGSYIVKLIDPPLFIRDYSVGLLDETGSLITKKDFDKKDTVMIPLSKVKNKKEVYFVVNSPFWQKTVRIKL